MRKLEICKNCSERRFSKIGKDGLFIRGKHKCGVNYKHTDEWKYLRANVVKGDVYFDCALDKQLMLELESKYVLRGVSEGCKYALEQLVINQ